MDESPSIHKANPRERDAETTGAAHCVTCGAWIKRVPGGHGPIWIHEDSGAVAAPGAEREA